MIERRQRLIPASVAVAVEILIDPEVAERQVFVPASKPFSLAFA